MEDDQNGRQPKWQTTKMEDDQKGRQPKWKMTKMEDDQNVLYINQFKYFVTAHPTPPNLKMS